MELFERGEFASLAAGGIEVGFDSWVVEGCGNFV
jgi:hypothetical protein